MADDIFLTGPLGTQWNIGSWVEKSAGVDFGAAQLVRQTYGQNAWAEGARLGFESAAGPRRMTFPLIVPSGGVAGLSLDVIESSLRQMVRPGGFVDLRLDGVWPTDAVRFDILGGDVAHRNYTVDVQRIDRRRFTLSLDTQPFGYWPTWITLASVASWGLLPLPFTGGGSFFGDVPGPAIISAQPTVISASAGGTSLADMVAWGFGTPSFLPWLRAASWDASVQDSRIAVGGGTLMVGSWHPFTEFLRFPLPSVGGGSAFGLLTTYTIPQSLLPAMAGRYRAFVLGNFDSNGYIACWSCGVRPPRSRPPACRRASTRTTAGYSAPRMRPASLT
jgi:hypothetical protein